LPHKSGTKRFIRSQEQTSLTEPKYASGIWRKGRRKVIIDSTSQSAYVIQMEFISYSILSAVGGKAVRLANSRELDMISSPVHIGLAASIKLGLYP
jgi:hypothetical protein